MALLLCVTLGAFSPQVAKAEPAATFIQPSGAGVVVARSGGPVSPPQSLWQARKAPHTSLIAQRRVWRTQTLVAPKVPCRCRYDGLKFELGETVCMRAPGGGLRRMKCDRVLNNTSWTFVGNGCDGLS